MFSLPEAWVWNFWIADDGETYHLFFSYASKAPRRPGARHHRASIGHAVSTDLYSWTRVDDALAPSDTPAFDDLTTSAGSTVRHPDGTWFLFYTGSTLTPAGVVQSIGCATSLDLLTWHRAPGPAVRADPCWYEKLTDGHWPDEAFRDPCVFPDPDGNGWHMLITARANTGPVDDRGVVGHASSANLRDWRLGPPLSRPGQGFGQLEVMQVQVVDGVPLLMFSCLAADASSSRRATGTTGGVWVSAAENLLGPYDVSAVQQVTNHELYGGRMIRRRIDGQWLMLAAERTTASGRFVGTITDPWPVRYQDGRLKRAWHRSLAPR